MKIDLVSPFPFESLPRTWCWMEPFRGKVSDDFSPQSQADFMQAMAAKWDSIRTWAVYGDGELGGLITFEKLSPWVGTAHFLLKEQFHRKGIAVKAAREAAAEIFEHEGVGKLVFHPLAGNLAIGSLLCNLGARREGTLVGHTLAGGQPTDMWVYGLLKTEFLNHASSSDSCRNRRPRLDRGVAPVGRAEDHDAAGQLEHQQLEHVVGH